MSIRQKLSRLRYHIRKEPWVSALAYMLPNVGYAVIHWRGAQSENLGARLACGRVAICLRFKNEARFLSEWLDYYLAAGVKHFFLYNNFSIDNYQEVLRPYEARGVVTVIDWPRIPASPEAENDCIGRARGRFEWVGFLDADEFVVVRNGQSIPEFLSKFLNVPAVALHWYYYGSSGHERRPSNGVIRAYTRRALSPNEHFKVFVRPDQVTRNRNSHNFYFRRARCAVLEDGRRAYGSMARPAIAKLAWINHYYCKSLEDYLEKSAQISTLDRYGIKDPSRQVTLVKEAMNAWNDVEDTCAIDYFEIRLRQLASISPTEPLS